MTEIKEREWEHGKKIGLKCKVIRHSFGKLLTDWSTIPTGQRLYLIIMLGMYVYNIYQNGVSCYQFYKNTTTINNDIKNIKNFLGHTREKVGAHIVKIDKLKT